MNNYASQLGNLMGRSQETYNLSRRKHEEIISLNRHITDTMIEPKPPNLKKKQQQLMTSWLHW